MQSEFSCEQCQKLLVEFVENSINPLQRQRIDQHLMSCEDCSENLQQLWEMQSLATRWRDEPVPRWSRRALFFESFNWWPNLQLISAFASVLVLVLVLGNAEISTRDGFAIRFGNHDYLTKSELAREVATLKNQLRSEQRDLLQINVANLTNQQIATNQLLLRTVLDRSRQERRDDLDTLVATWDLVQDQQSKQTRNSIRVLLVNQIEDRRNIKQLNKVLSEAAFKGSAL